MTPLEQIKKDWDKEFPETDNGQHVLYKHEVIWNFISQKILETEKRVARESVEEFVDSLFPYEDEDGQMIFGNEEGDFIFIEALKKKMGQFINSLESKGGK